MIRGQCGEIRPDLYDIVRVNGRSEKEPYRIFRNPAEITEERRIRKSAGPVRAASPDQLCQVFRNCPEPPLALSQGFIGMDTIGDIDHYPDEAGNPAFWIIERGFFYDDIPLKVICMGESCLVNLDSTEDHQLRLLFC